MSREASEGRARGERGESEGRARGERGEREGERIDRGKGRVPSRGGDIFWRGGHLRGKRTERATRRTALFLNCR